MKMDGSTVQTKFIIRRHPERGGRHPNWQVFDSTDDSLICVCAYQKGAEALVERLWATDRIIAHLIQRNALEDVSDASNITLRINA